MVNHQQHIKRLLFIMQSSVYARGVEVTRSHKLWLDFVDFMSTEMVVWVFCNKKSSNQKWTQSLQVMTPEWRPSLKTPSKESEKAATRATRVCTSTKLVLQPASEIFCVVFNHAVFGSGMAKSVRGLYTLSRLGIHTCFLGAIGRADHWLFKMPSTNHTNLPSRGDETRCSV